MKITLDLSRLVEDGRLTPADSERLTALASRETGALGINILIGFGVGRRAPTGAGWSISPRLSA